MLIKVIIVLLVILLFLISIVGLFYPEIHRIIARKSYRKKVYKVLHFYAEENDQLLLNNAMIIFPDEKTPVIFDHILIADKYVYVIQDIYYDGGIYGNLQDQSLFHEDLRKHTEKIDNPLYINGERIRKLEQMINVEPDAKLFVNVVCYNKELILQDGMKKKEQGLFFLPVNELEETIKAAEQDEVQAISHEKSERLINLFKERSERIKNELMPKGRRK